MDRGKSATTAALKLQLVQHLQGAAIGATAHFDTRAQGAPALPSPSNFVYVLYWGSQTTHAGGGAFLVGHTDEGVDFQTPDLDSVRRGHGG